MVLVPTPWIPFPFASQALPACASAIMWSDMGHVNGRFASNSAHGYFLGLLDYPDGDAGISP